MIKRILFVCTGNLCRSPMAQCLFENMLARDPLLRSAGIEVESAGTTAGGYAATPEAMAVMHECGLDLSRHRSRPLNPGLIERADLILVMEAAHRERVAFRFPAAEAKTYPLTEYVGEQGEVPDPIGCGIEVYRECAALLESLLGKLTEKLRG